MEIQYMHIYIDAKAACIHEILIHTDILVYLDIMHTYIK